MALYRYGGRRPALGPEPGGFLGPAVCEPCKQGGTRSLDDARRPVPPQALGGGQIVAVQAEVPQPGEEVPAPPPMTGGARSPTPPRSLPLLERLSRRLYALFEVALRLREVIPEGIERPAQPLGVFKVGESQVEPAL